MKASDEFRLPRSSTQALKPPEDPESDAYLSSADDAPSVDASRGELFETSGLQMALGIIVAGGFYPLLLISISSGVAIIAVVWNAMMYESNMNWPHEMASAFWAMMVTACFLSLGGLVWSGIVCMVTLPVMHLIAWTLCLRGSIILWGAFCGGVVGFLAVLPFLLAFRDGQANWSNELLAWIVVLWTGPGITTVMGQIGGAWGGQRQERIERLYKRALRQASIDGWTASRAPSNSATASALTSQRAFVFQFGTRHLMWIAVWMSILLSVIRLSGVPFEFAIPLLLGWLIYQTGTLWIGWRLLPRIYAWRRRRA